MKNAVKGWVVLPSESQVWGGYHERLQQISKSDESPSKVASTGKVEKILKSSLDSIP